jgi:hypothetical protein
LKGQFDMVVIDPPFIVKDCWRKYGITSNLLLKQPPCPDANIVMDNAATTPPTAAAIAASGGGGGVNRSLSSGSLSPNSKRVLMDDDSLLKKSNFKAEEVADGNVELGGRALLTTVHENSELLYEIFKAKPNVFRPKIPNLVYQ